MARLVMLCLAVVSAACVSATGVHNPRCWYPGDTVAMLGPYRDATNTMRCTWLVADHISCLQFEEPGIAGKMTAADCVIPLV
jgi:hypothetical protein